MAADLDLATYLNAEAVGVLNTSLFAGTIPADVDNAIGLTMYPGPPPEQTCGSGGITIEIGRIQVSVRNEDEATAIANANAAAVALARIAGNTLSGVRYRSVVVLQTPGLLFRDDNDRPNYGFNIEYEKAMG